MIRKIDIVVRIFSLDFLPIDFDDVFTKNTTIATANKVVTTKEIIKYNGKPAIIHSVKVKQS